MASSAVITSVRQKYQALAPFFHEKARRCWAACEAMALGRGGISVVAAATDLARPTIRRGIAELQAGDYSPDATQPDHPRHRSPSSHPSVAISLDDPSADIPIMGTKPAE
jgi:hypothetical protein